MREETIYHSEAEVDSFFTSLTSENSKAVNRKLDAIHSVCKKLVNKKVDVTVPLLVKHLTEAGVSISEQSLYNPKSGKKANPYKLLYSAWQSYGSNKASKMAAASADSRRDSSLKDEELAEIGNPVLRYKIALVNAEVKSLRRQNDLIRQVKELPIMSNSQPEAIESDSPQSLPLLQYNQDLIREFLRGNSFLSFDDKGRLYAKRAISKGVVLSADDLQDALLALVDGDMSRDG